MTITEQARQLRTGGQAVDFRGASLEVLEKMGLLGQVRASATRMGPLILVDEHGKEVGRLPAEVISGELEIFWGDLARILYEAVRDNVNYRFGIRVTALNDDGERVEATFSDASTGSYHLVIGADGLHSSVRGLVFGPEEHYVTQLGQCFGFFDIQNRLRLDHCGMACATSGRTAVLQATDPDKPARASFYLSDAQLAFDYRDTERNKRLFAERYAGMGWEVPNMLDGLAEASEVYFDSIAQVHLESYSRGRVCLIGDAAWCASPRSGGHQPRGGRRLRAGSRAGCSGWRPRDSSRQLSAVTGTVRREVPEARHRRPEDGQLLIGLARPTTQSRYSTAEHPGHQQGSRQAVTGRRTFLHPAELLTRKLYRGRAVAAGAARKASRAFQRFGGHPEILANS